MIRRGMSRRSYLARARALAGLSTVLVASACYTTGDGAQPPSKKIYFPVGIAIQGDVMYLANSDFDLQYNGGTIQAYDLKRIRDHVAKNIARKGVPDKADKDGPPYTVPVPATGGCPGELP